MLSEFTSIGETWKNVLVFALFPVKNGIFIQVQFGLNALYKRLNIIAYILSIKHVDPASTLENVYNQFRISMLALEN